MWVLRFRCFYSPGIKGERKRVGGGFVVVYFHTEVLNILNKVSKFRVSAYREGDAKASLL